MAVCNSTSRPQRGDAAILRAQSILSERLREPGASLSRTGSVRDLLRLKLADKKQELFIALWLDTQNRLIFPEELARGTLTQTAIYPREVVKSALHHNAASVIFAHNHPSGVADPSRADLAMTAGLIDALRLIDVRVLDHFIVGGLADPLSFAERGLLAGGVAEPPSADASAPAVQEQATIKHDFSFTTTDTLYSVSEKASRSDVHNQLNGRLGQLSAMLTITCGVGAGVFDDWSTEIKDDYLWACAMIAKECRELAGLI